MRDWLVPLIGLIVTAFVIITISMISNNTDEFIKYLGAVIIICLIVIIITIISLFRKGW